MQFLDFAIRTAEKAGKFIQKQSQKAFKTTEKNKNDFVTEVDIATENLIIKEIHKKYGNHGILAEETCGPDMGPHEFTKHEYLWIIDPIDGTNNFRRGIPFYCVSIALFKSKSKEKSKNYEYLEGELIVGVIYAPALDKLFYAEKGKGAYLNGKQIKVSKADSLYRSLMATGFHGEFKQYNLPYFEKIMKASQGFRRNGSAALDLAHTAEGVIEGYWEFGLKPWDIAAGALIVKEAGGRVTDTFGNMLDLFGQNILATNTKIHKETIKLFSKIKN